MITVLRQKKTLPTKLKGELTRLGNVINKTADPAKLTALVARKNQIQKLIDSNPQRGWTDAKMGKREGAAARVESRRAISDAVVDSFSQRKLDLEAAFKDSKVRNKDGSLMEVYHGTGAERIDAFDMSRGGQRTYAKSAKMAFFFTDNYSVAETYRVGEYDTTSVQEYIDALTAEELEAVADSRFSQMFGGFEDDADINYKWTKENFMTLVNTLDRGEDMDGFRDFVKGMERTWKKHIPQPESWERVKKSYEKGYGSVMKFYLNMTNPYEVQVDDGFEEGLFSDSIVKAKELGHDGVIFRNADDAILPWDSKESIMSDVVNGSAKCGFLATEVWEFGRVKCGFSDPVIGTFTDIVPLAYHDD
jgi:hypothetical protein